jgi:hypothetical protein
VQLCLQLLLVYNHGGNDSQKSNGYYSCSSCCYINANPGINDAWLDVVLPSESGAFKMQDGFH